MELINENTTRRIDSLGRIGVPKGIRNRMRLEVNQEMEFFTLRDDGREYIVFAPVQREDNEDEKYALVADLLSELGIDIPEEVLSHI